MLFTGQEVISVRELVNVNDDHCVLSHRFIVYKLPRLPDSRHEAAQRGVGQMYMDVNSQHWRLLDKEITEREGHAVYHTLQQIYSSYQNTVSTFRRLVHCVPVCSCHVHYLGMLFYYTFA